MPNGKRGTSSLPPPEQPNVVNHDCRFQSRRRGKGDANGSRERERAYIIIAPPPSDLAQLKKEGKNFPQRPSSFYSIRMIHVGRRKGRKEKRPPRGHLAQEGGGGGGGGSSITSFRCFLLTPIVPKERKESSPRKRVPDTAGDRAFGKVLGCDFPPHVTLWRIWVYFHFLILSVLSSWKELRFFSRSQFLFDQGSSFFVGGEPGDEFAFTSGSSSSNSLAGGAFSSISSLSSTSTWTSSSSA